jgi:DNA-binding response OmpR family regulator
MPKKILLIENDATLAERLTAGLEEAGFETRVTGDGKEGLDLARDWTPEAIVLCVELPGMSGYLVCQKLKKDEALKAIPLVLTSAEATEETFEKHRTLKARADEYLLKPYEPADLATRLGALVGLPEGAPEGGGLPEEEELVSLEEEVGLGAGAAGEPGAEVGGLDLASLPDEASGAEQPAADADLRLLDDAFDGISAAPEPAGAEEAAAALDELTGEKPVAVDEVDAAAALLPDEDERAARAALDGVGGLGDEADAALGALGGADETLSPGLRLDGAAPDAAPRRTAPVRGATADLLRAAGIKVLDEAATAVRAAAIDAPLPAAAPGIDPAELSRLEAELADRDTELDALRRKLVAADRRAGDAEAETAQANGRIEAAQEKARKAEADARAGKDEARRAADQARALEGEVADLRKRSADAERRAAELEKRAADLDKRVAAAEQDARRKAEEAAAAAEALARAEALEREADELRTELLVARGEADGARGEVEKRTAELKKRVADLETTNAKNEERVVKAYQKIKSDEKVRDKVRKALAIAAQLVDDALPPESPAEKDRRAAAAAAAAAAAGREPQ